jgi:hypothetical protein
VAPATLSPAPRKPKIVDARGTFKSVRERVIEAIPAAVSTAPSGGEVRLDLGDYADRSAILKSYQSRDYSTCLDLLNARTERQTDLLNNPLCLLLKALLLQHLNRLADLRSVIVDFSELITMKQVQWPGGSHAMALPFMEALGQHKEAEGFVTRALAAAHADLVQTGPNARRQEIHDTVLLYRDRARTRILQGNMAGALADEREALALPPGTSGSGRPESAEEAQQLHLNTIVMEWELLEQEFPEYNAYLAANGSPEPKPDHRNLRAVD